MPKNDTQTNNKAGLSFGSRTDVGHVRDHNEDSLIVVPPLFAVADGMGGHEAGEVASELTIKTLEELAPNHPDAQALERAVEAANLNVLRAPSDGIGREGMGTTLTAAMVEGERLLIAQVGDSRAYLLHEGELQQLTRDHSLMMDLIEAGQITPEQARVHPNRSVITRAIGSDPNMKPDIYELNIASGDRLLLCSDGLSTMLEDDEIQSVMRHTPDPQQCASNLVDAALQAGGYDNVTVVVVDVEGFKHNKIIKERRKSHALAIGVSIAIVLAFALGIFGGWQYINNSAYLIEENGTVSVYRGINDNLFGIPLSSLERTTTINVDDLQPGVANRIKEGMSVGGIDEANRLIQSYEEEIERQRTADISQNAASANENNGEHETTTASSNDQMADGD